MLQGVRPAGAKARTIQCQLNAFVLTGRSYLKASQPQGDALGYRLLGLQPVGYRISQPEKTSLVVNDLRTFEGKTARFGVDLLGLLSLYGYIIFILIYIKKHCFCVKTTCCFLVVCGNSSIFATSIRQKGCRETFENKLIQLKI